MFDGLEFFSPQGTPLESKERWDAMVGLDYNGINDTTITVEAATRRIHDFEPTLDETGEEIHQYALSYRGDFLNQGDLVEPGDAHYGRQYRGSANH